MIVDRDSWSRQYVVMMGVIVVERQVKVMGVGDVMWDAVYGSGENGSSGDGDSNGCR